MSLEISQQLIGSLIGAGAALVVSTISAIIVVTNITRQLRQKAMTDAALSIWEVLSELQMTIHNWGLSEFSESDQHRSRINDDLHPRLMRAFRSAQLLVDVSTTNHIHDIIGDLAQLNGRSEALALEKRLESPSEARHKIRAQLRALEDRLNGSFESTLVSLQSLIHPATWARTAKSERKHRQWYKRQSAHRPLIPDVGGADATRASTIGGEGDGA